MHKGKTSIVTTGFHNIGLCTMHHRELAQYKNTDYNSVLFAVQCPDKSQLYYIIYSILCKQLEILSNPLTSAVISLSYMLKHGMWWENKPVQKGKI